MNVTFPLWGKVKCFCTREILVGWYSLDLGDTWQNSIGGFVDPTNILVDTLDAMQPKYSSIIIGLFIKAGSECFCQV